MKASFIAALAALSLVAVGAAQADVPTQYRYAGTVIRASGSVPTHALVEGDGIGFTFTDENSPRGFRYTLCLFKRGKAQAFRCWQREPRRHSDLFMVGDLHPSPYGALTAKWMIGGRVVTIWHFLYQSEGA